jgi:hypothetical protein
VVNLLSLATKTSIPSEPFGLVLHRAALSLAPCIRAEDKNILALIFRYWIFFDVFSRQVQILTATYAKLIVNIF